MAAEMCLCKHRHILRNTILALLDYPDATLSDILRLLSDRQFRTRVLDCVGNPEVRAFWLRDYQHWPPRLRLEAIAPLQNKVGAFLSDSRLARILTKPERTLHIRKMMDEGKVLLVNLSRGAMGDAWSHCTAYAPGQWLTPDF